jgi:hypothetical protein
MRKVAIFVEGQTELIFVRESLLRLWEYQNIQLECRTLFTDHQYNHAEYDYINPSAGFHFEIINVGNDNAVVPRILSREKYLWNQGFELILGLRDMYSKDYRELNSKSPGKINSELIQKFTDGAASTVNGKSSRPERIFIHFAIMEVEAWFLGMYQYLERHHEALTSDHLLKEIGLSLENCDPETEIYHPTTTLDSIYQLVGERYGKSRSEIEAILSLVEKDDLLALAASGKCASFARFYADLLRQA